MKAIWHYEENGESKGPLSREEIRGLVQAGVITSQTKVWTYSLKKWMPAAETTLENLFKATSTVSQPQPSAGPSSPPPPPPPPPPPSPSATAESQGGWVPLAEVYNSSGAGAQTFPDASFRDPVWLAHVLTALLVLLTLLTGVEIWAGWEQLDLIYRIQHHAPNIQEEVLMGAMRYHIIAISRLVIYAITGIFFGCWTYRVAKNVRALGARRLQFTPGWAVGFYFIPILGLWKPYQAMKEIWRASGDPQNWRSTRSSPLLVWWWTFWIFSSVFHAFVSRFMSTGGGQDDTATLMVNTISGFTYFPLNVAAILLVEQLSERQSQAAMRGS